MPFQTPQILMHALMILPTIVIGIICGVLSVLFSFLNLKVGGHSSVVGPDGAQVNRFRNRFIVHSRALRVAEVLLIAVCHTILSNTFA